MGKHKLKAGRKAQKQLQMMKREKVKRFLGIGNVLRRQDKTRSGLWQTWKK